MIINGLLLKTLNKIEYPSYDFFIDNKLNERLNVVLVRQTPNVQRILWWDIWFINNFEKSLSEDDGALWLDDILSLKLEEDEYLDELVLDDYLDKLKQNHSDCSDVHYLIALEKRGLAYMFENLYDPNNIESHKNCLQILFNKTKLVFRNWAFVVDLDATISEIRSTPILDDEQLGKLIIELNADFEDYAQEWIEDISYTLNASSIH